MTCSQIDRYVAILVVVICASGCEKTAPRHNASNPADPTPPATLPILVELPDFVLHDQSGKQFGSEQLQGKPWIANFIFTRCPTTCPIQTRQLAKFQKQLKKIPAGEDVELVSITVDPQFDSSAVLAEYAKRMEADLENWHFLTGSRDSIWDLCKKGFKLAVDDAPPEAPSPIMHSSRMMLVDQEGRIRGFYEGTTREGLDAMRTAVEQLLQSEPKPQTPQE